MGVVGRLLELNRVRRKLREAGVLGMNRRNADYLARYNPRSRYPLVDDKLKTKALAQQAGISVPPLYGVISYHHEVRSLGAILHGRDSFVIKPARGSGGEGVVVVGGRSGDLFRKVAGGALHEHELRHHVSNTLGGMFSLAGQTDRAIIEYRVEADPVFDAISFRGVPDVRIIVLLGVPVMAMVRLPTRLSDGKANLHQGAIGAGIDLASGHTTCAVWRNLPIDVHPDTGAAVAGVAVPRWDELLLLASRCYELTSLGYIGVDIVLDAQHGPMILEMNARPGLSIQLANGAGLLPRLQTVERYAEGLTSAEARVAFAQQHFGAPLVLKEAG